MKVIELNRAVGDIRNLSQGASPPALPFFFIVGAGLSAPIVKTASQLEAMLREKATAADPDVPVPGGGADAMQRYAYWFDAAFPSREGRRRFLESAIRDMPISPAAYRLAHLLYAGKIGHIVVTPNFDDFISRALTLFGRRHVVCDHPAEAERLNPESPEIQIVHVHGTYWFYDAANLAEELEEKAQPDGAGFTSLSRRIEDLLTNRSPIVIGYSGWERDVIMKALRQRLKGPLKTPLYWFCYNAADFEGLPAFLRAHPDVRVVVSSALKSRIDAKSRPEAVSAAVAAQLRDVTMPGGAPAAGGSGQGGGADAFGIASAAMTGTPAQSGPEELSADIVLRRLVGAVDPEVPAMLRKPLRAFADHLSSAFPQDAQREADDVLWFRRVIRRVEEVRTSAFYEFDEQVDPVVDALVRGRPADALVEASRVVWTKATARQKAEFAEIVYAAARQLNDNSRVERDGYALTMDVLSSVDRKTPLEEPQLGLLRRAMYNRSLVSTLLNDYADVIPSAESFLKRFREPEGDRGRLQRANAFMQLAVARQEKAPRQSIGALRSLVREFAGDPDKDMRLLVARAMGLWGFLEQLYGKPSAGSRIFERLVTEYSGSEDPEVRAAVVSAFGGRAGSLLQSGKPAQASEAFAELIRRFGDSAEIPTQREVATAYSGLVSALALAGRSEDALEAAASAEARFGSSTDAETRRRASLARVNALVALFQHRKFAETVETAARLIAAAAEPSGPSLDSGYTVSVAYVFKIMAERQQDQLAAAEQTCDEAIARFTGNASPMPQIARATALVMKALLRQSHDREGALALLEEVGRDYASSPLVIVRQQAAHARYNHARILMEGASVARGLEELRALASDARLVEDESLRGIAAAAAMDVGAALLSRGDRDGAAQVYQELIDRFGDFEDATTRLNVANACWNQSRMLADTAGDSAAELEKLDETIRRTRGVREAPFVERATFALARKAIVLSEGGNTAAATASIDEALALLDSFKAPATAPIRPWLELQRSHIHRNAEQYDEELRILTAILDGAGAAPRDAMQLETVAAAYGRAAVTLVRLGRPAEALPRVDAGMAYIEAAPESYRSNFTPALLFPKMLALRALGETDPARRLEARQVAEDIVQRFGGSDDPAVAPLVESARELLDESPLV